MAGKMAARDKAIDKRMGKAAEKKDAAYDKKMGIKEGSPRDMKMDARMAKRPMFGVSVVVAGKKAPKKAK